MQDSAWNKLISGVGADGAVREGLAERVESLGRDLQRVVEEHSRLQEAVTGATGGAESVVEPLTRLEVFHQYMAIFVVAFLVSLFATPLMRRMAVANGIVDRPSEARKHHRMPIAYLGGVAIYLGLIAGVAFSYFAPAIGLISFHVESPAPMPVAILGAMTVIVVIGLVDDVWKIDPRLKIGGQLLTAAVLAFNDIGVKVAAGVLGPIGGLFGNERMVFDFAIPDSFPVLSGHYQFDLIYWAGTAVIAIFVLGACNASNLLDGLDGLLTGVTSIAMFGLLFIALTMAVLEDGPLDTARLVLILAALGACLGFLPHNFNPANIFLGDAGSMLLGFTTAAVILSLGDTGKTHLVVAGLIIYAVPLIDTTLAIIRRKMSGASISAADDQHLHHQLKRSLGVKGAVLTLYGIGAVFAALGVGMSLGRGRVIYAIALVLAAFIGVTAFKVARRGKIEQEVAASEARREARLRTLTTSAPSVPSPAAAQEPPSATAGAR